MEPCVLAVALDVAPVAVVVPGVLPAAPALVLVDPLPLPAPDADDARVPVTSMRCPLWADKSCDPGSRM
jgi:hypothetical protein